jgi:hypothetical protein
VIADEIKEALGLPRTDVSVIVEFQVVIPMDELDELDSDYEFWQYVLDQNPHKTRVISASQVKHE